MKKIIIIFSAIALFIFSSCQKEHLQPLSEINSLKSDNHISQAKILQLKTWYETHRKTVNGTLNRDEYSLYPPAILWETGIFIPADQAYIFKINEFEEGEINTSNLFAVYLNEDGDISTGEYIFTRTPGSTSGMTLTEIWARYVKVFEGEEIPMDLEASQIKYGIDGEWLYSKQISNQVITNTVEKIKTEEKVPIHLPDEGIMICVDSWWVTWDPDTGVILNILYLGSECHTYGGSGGGGSNPSLCNMNTEQALAYLNGLSFEKGTGSITSGTEYLIETTRRKPIMSKLTFVRFLILGVEYNAYFVGTCYKNELIPYDHWKFETLSYSSNSKSATLPPCMSDNVTIDCTPMIFSANREEARATFHYQVEFQIPCLPGSPATAAFEETFPEVLFNAHYNYVTF